jgi:hypothetical protein
MTAIPTTKLLQINLDPVVAVGIARGSLPRLMKYRDQLVKEVPKFDLVNLDKLGVYALGFLQTHTAYGIATLPPEDLARLAEEASTLQGLLFSDASALAKRGLLNSAPLNDLRGPTGYRNVAMDVLGLALLLRNNWDTISSKTCVTLSELDRAEVVGQQLLDAVCLREQSPTKIAQATLERQQAYTLFVNAYDQVRRAINFLRWNEGDADTIAPSLYSGRATSRKKATSDIDKPTATPVTPTTPGTAAPTIATTTPEKSPAVGLPGANPFTN